MNSITVRSLMPSPFGVITGGSARTCERASSRVVEVATDQDQGSFVSGSRPRFSAVLRGFSEPGLKRAARNS